MKKIIALLCSIILVLALTACGNTENAPSNESTDSQPAVSEVVSSSEPEESTTTPSQSTYERTLPEPELGDTRIRFSWDDKELVVRLIDNTATENLLKMLPMSIEFEDYINRQKNGYLPEELDWEGSPNECDRFNGDLTYYAPWNILSFFYEDCGYIDHLVPMGRIESGLEYLTEMDSVTVTIEVVE